MPYAATSTDHPAAQFALGGLAALVAVAAIPRVLDRRPNLTVPALIGPLAEYTLAHAALYRRRGGEQAY